MSDPQSLERIQLYIEAHHAAWEYEETTGKTLTKDALIAFVNAYIDANLG